MSEIKVEDLELGNYTKTLKTFTKKLEELSSIEKQLKIEGFEIIVKPIKK